MKKLLFPIIALSLSSCMVNDAHNDNSIIGTWSGLIKIDTRIEICTYGEGYKIIFYQPDETFEMHVASILDTQMSLPDGFYFGYHISGEFKHLTPTTLDFICVDTIGNPIDMGFFKTW